MRCVACGAEMRLVRAVPAETMMVAGYEHRTFECPGCHEQERRLVFTREIGSVSPERMRLPSAPSGSPAAIGRSAALAARGAWARAVAMLRGRLDRGS
jgi:hypothetical protein